MRLLSLLLTFSLLPFLASAQQHKEIGVFTGLATYAGDLVDAGITLKGAGFVGGLVYKDYASPKIGLKAGLNFGQFSGDDANFPGAVRDRNFTFQSNFIELNGSLELAPFAKSDGSSRFTPFIHGGLSYLHLNSSTSAEGRIKLLAEDDNPNKNFITLPAGLGLRFGLTEKLTLSAQGSVYFFAGDYLDGISISGNPDGKDLLYTGGISLTYQLMSDVNREYNLK